MNQDTGRILFSLLPVVYLALLLKSYNCSAVSSGKEGVSTVTGVGSQIMRRKIVGVCGSGISGSLAANILAKNGFEVHIFEAGRGPGGRTSTRRHEQHSFDHGAQYIKTAKTTTFKSLMDEWIADDILKEWTGNFVDYDEDASSFTLSTSRRYVAVPAMNSLCRKLVLNKNNIHCHFAQRIKATPAPMTLTEPGSGLGSAAGWHVVDAQTGNLIKEVDWLLTTDKSSMVKVPVVAPTTHDPEGVTKTSASASNADSWDEETNHSGSIKNKDKTDKNDESHYQQRLHPQQPPTPQQQQQQQQAIDAIQELERDTALILDSVGTAPVLTAMVLLDSPVPRSVLPYDSVTFLSTPPPNAASIGTRSTGSSSAAESGTDHMIESKSKSSASSRSVQNPQQSIIGWIARDSSKPDRTNSSCSKECWVIQSTTQFADEVIQQMNQSHGVQSQIPSFEELKQRVNKVTNETLVEAFIHFVQQHQQSTLSNGQKNSAPVTIDTTTTTTGHYDITDHIVHTIGHRWGAAFPVIDTEAESYEARNVLLAGAPMHPGTSGRKSGSAKNLTTATTAGNGAGEGRGQGEGINGQAYVNPTIQFAACGDFFDPTTAGRVEGAANSAVQAVNLIISCTTNDN